MDDWMHAVSSEFKDLKQTMSALIEKQQCHVYTLEFVEPIGV